MPLHTSHNSHREKDLQTIIAGEGVVKRELYCTIGGKQYGTSLKNYHMIQQSHS